MSEWTIEGRDVFIERWSDNELETITREEAELRLNEYETLKKATERLSAEDAVRLANALDDIAVAWDGEDAGEGTKRLRAYADILERK